MPNAFDNYLKRNIPNIDWGPHTAPNLEGMVGFGIDDAGMGIKQGTVMPGYTFDGSQPWNTPWRKAMDTRTKG